jgi:hypothetical protein
MPDPNELLLRAAAKQDNLAQTTEAKRLLLLETATAKASSLENQSAVEALRGSLRESVKAPEAITEFETPDYREDLVSALYRGGAEAVKGVPMLAWGLAAGAGAAAETMFGGGDEGDFTTEFKEYAVGKYQAWERDISRHAQPEDAFGFAYDEAKKGDIGALISWATHGTGYVATQLATLLTGVGLVQKGTEMVGKKAVTKLMSGLVKKEAERIAAKTGLKAGSDQAMRAATATVTKKLGQQIGMAGAGFGMEGGEIGGGLASQSVEEGEPLTGAEVTKGLAASAAAGAVEYMETLLGLKAITGKLGKLPGATNIPGVKGRVARTAVAGGKVAPAEFAQEYVQTGIEQWGQGATWEELTSDEMGQERFDAGMLGALSFVTGAGSLVQGTPAEQAEKSKERQIKFANTKQIKPEIMPGYEEEVKAAVEAKDVDQYLDPAEETYNPVMASRVNEELAKAATPEERQTIIDKQRDIYNNLYDENVVIAEELKKLDPEVPENAETILALNKTLEQNMAIQGKVKESLDTLAQPGVEAIPDTLVKEIKAAVEQKDDEKLAATVKAVYGSKADPKQVKADIERLAAAQENLEGIGQTITKSARQVHADLTASGRSEKSADDYLNNITAAIKAGDTKKATTELAGLQKFTADRMLRAETFQAMQESWKQKKSLASLYGKEKAALYTSKMSEYNMARQAQGKKPYFFGPKFQETIDYMQAEKDVFAATETLATNLVAAEEQTPTRKEAATEAQPAKGSSPKAEKPVSKQTSPSSPQEAGTEGEVVPLTTRQKNLQRMLTRPGRTATERIEQFNAASKTLDDMTPELEDLADKVSLEAEKEKTVIDKQTSVTEKEKPGKPVTTQMPAEEFDADQLEPLPEEATQQLTEEDFDDYFAAEEEEAIEDTRPKEVQDSAVESDLPIEIVDEIPLPKGRTVPVIMRNTGKAILYVPSLLSQKFKEKAWTKRIKLADGSISIPLPADIFKTKQDLFDFMVTHENLHNTITREEGETISAYENRINQAALIEMDPLSAGKYPPGESFQKKLTTSEKPESDAFLNKNLNINPFKEFFTTGKGSQILNTSLDLLATMKTMIEKRLVHRQPGFTDQTDKQIAKANRVVTSLIGLTEQFHISAEKIFKTFDKNYLIDNRYRKNKQGDPLGFFAEDGKLEVNVVNALGAAAHKYLATKGMSTLQNVPEDIIKILGLKEDHNLSETAMSLVGNIGISANVMLWDMGDTAYKLIGIQPETDSKGQIDSDLVNRTKIALGQMAISILQEQGYLEEHTIAVGYKQVVERNRAGAITNLEALDQDSTGNVEAMEHSDIGLAGLIAYEGMYAHPDDQHAVATMQEFEQNLIDNFELITSEEGREVKYNTTIIDGVEYYLPRTSFFRIVDQSEGIEGQLTTNIQDWITKPWSESPHTWSRLLYGELDPDTYSWKKPRDHKAPRKIAEGALASETRDNNLDTYEQKGWQANLPIMGLVMAMGVDNHKKLMGYKNPNDFMASRNDSVEGTNLGIDRSINSMYAWMEDALTQDENADLSREFYIRNFYAKSTRMHQRGPINPQGDKNHRAVFKMSGWNSTFKPQAERSEVEKLFILAVGLTLDVDITKTEGNGTTALDQTILDIETILQDPIMADALAVLQNLDTDLHPTAVEPGKTLTQTESDILLAAAKKGGVKVETLRGLHAYAQYLNAIENNEEFTTDLAIELDGISNGPTIARLQLMTNAMDGAITMKSLENSGVIFDASKATDLATQLAAQSNHDAYQLTGWEWAKQIEAMQNRLANEANDSELEKYEIKRAAESFYKNAAVTTILGDFRDDTGHVSKAVRSLTKYPTMKTIYGMADATQKVEFAQTFFNEVMDQIEDIANEPDQTKARAALKVLDESLITLLGHSIFKSDVVKNGKIDKKAILQTKISAKDASTIITHLDENHGQALVDAFGTIYGDMRRVMFHYKQAIAASSAYYNMARRVMIDKALAESENEVLTIAEMEAIEERLIPMRPQIMTALGDKINAGPRDNSRNYVDGRPVTQVYQPGTVSQKVNQAPILGGLETPTNKGTTSTVLSYDAATANMIIGEAMSALNTHDGFTVTLDQALTFGQNLNNHFFDLISKHNMGGAIYAGMHASQAAVKEMLKAEGVSRKVSDKILFEELGNMGVYKSMDKYGNPITFIDENTGEEHTLNIKWEAKRQNIPWQETVFNIYSMAHKMGALGHRIKREVMSNVEAMIQYYVPLGQHTTGNTAAENINIGGQIVSLRDLPDANLGSLAEQITLLDAAKEETAKLMENYNKTVDAVIQVNSALIKETIKEESSLGTSENTISTEPDEYNAAELVSAENAVGVYNSLKNDPNVQNNSVKKDSVEHDTHLLDVLDRIVSTVMKPVDVFMKVKARAEAEGRFVPREGANDQIFLQLQGTDSGLPDSGALATGIRMSPGEVYVHELIHAITHAALDSDQGRKLRKQVEKVFEHARKHLDYTAFLNDPTMDVNDPANIYEVQAAEERWEYIFGTDSQSIKEVVDKYTDMSREEARLRHLDEFIAIGMTNENFRKATLALSMPAKEPFSKWEGVLVGNLQEMIVNIFTKITDIIFNTFRSGQQEATVGQEIERLVVKLSEIDSDAKTGILSTITKADGKYGQALDWANNALKNKLKSTSAVKTANALKTLHKKVKNDETIGKPLRQMSAWYHRQDYGILKSLVTEIDGLNDRMAWLHKMLNRRNILLDTTKEQQSAAFKSIAEELFKDLTEVQTVALTKAGLKTDLSAILDAYGIQNLEAILMDENVRDRHIGDIRAQLMADPAFTPQMVNYFMRASDAMAYRMVTGRVRKGDIAWANAKIIGNLKNTPFAGQLTDAQAAVAEEAVDKMGTIMAIGHTAQEHNNQLAILLSNQQEGVNGFLRMHQQLKNLSLEIAFQGNGYQFMKGYTKQIFNPKIQYEVGTLDDQEYFEKRGYVRSSQPIARDAHDPTAGTPVYAYVGRQGKANNLMSMITSFTNNRARGANSQTLARQFNLSTSEGRANNAEILKAKENLVRDMFKNNVYPKAYTADNGMVPQVDDQGQVLNYAYIMSDSTKDNYMEQNNNYADIMGAMAGQVIDKDASPEINRELVRGLKAMYDQEYQSMPENYVEISPYTNDEEMRELYYRLPDKMRQEIVATWGSKRIYVAKDVVAIAFGFKHYTMTEPFSKDPAEMRKLEKIFVDFANWVFRGNNVVVKVNNIEDVMMELTKFAKDSIIVKTLTVSLVNFGSNLWYLRTQRVPVSMIIKYASQALKYGIQYQADSKKRRDLQVKKDLLLLEPTPDAAAIKRLDYKIARLDDNLARNPTTEFIEAGGMPAVIDDVDTDVTQSNYPGMVEETVGRIAGRLPQPVQNVGKVLFMTQDTPGYKLLNNTVKMTDYIGRYTLYQHYIKSEKKGHEEAMASVIDEFVNFNLPTHKMIEYFNQLGLLWFTKFGIRILKPIKNAAIDKPFDALLSFMASEHIGMDNIFNSIPFITSNPFRKLGNPISAVTSSFDDIFMINTLKGLFGK